MYSLSPPSFFSTSAVSTTGDSLSLFEIIV
jgi:hypothetical protein